jgi:2-C-methyl-D-erythritol 4-phosphate cytidylyltransferase
MSYSVIIPAAGSGSRMGAAVPKVLLTLGSEPFKKSIVRRSVEAFATDPECERVVVCVPKPWREQFERDLLELEGVVLVDGGTTRQESVRNGIEHLRTLDEVSGESIVLVHDAARCCVTREVISRLTAAVAQYGAAATAVRVVDSLCRSPDGGLGESVDRTNIWALQTPQGFLLQDLVRGHEEAIAGGVEALHDAALVTPFRSVRIVEGDRLNIKVTEPADLALAQTLLTACGEQAELVVATSADDTVGVRT